MNHPLPKSSRWLRTVQTAARWTGGLLLAALLLLAAAWAGVHAWIVPRIGDFRPLLEARASRAIGLPVSIGAITARSSGGVPSFELHDVALRDAAGREALRLPRVLGTLSPRSLWNLGFDQLVIERPVLDVRRDAGGRVFVAGIDVSAPDGHRGGAADWVFSQSEVVLRAGTVRWTDEQRGLPPLALEAVDAVSRNAGWRHKLRIDATPPVDWGQRFTLMGDFRQPLLSPAGRWQDWGGQVYGRFDQVDVAQLRRHADIGVDIAQGRGALQLWADVDRAVLTGGVADVALDAVEARFGAALEPLALQAVVGRLGGRRLAGGFEFSTVGLQFRTTDGLVWPGGNVHVSHTGGEGGRVPSQGVLRADRLDLAALTQIARRLPLAAGIHDAVAAYAPHGLVETLQARWQGALAAPTQYQAQGRVARLSLAAQPGGPGHAARPGVRGATVDFEVTQGGGKARFDVAQGAVEVPGVFDEPVVLLDRLAGSAQWQLDGERIALQLAPTRFANADAEGEVRLDWQTTAPGRGARFPGVLDLTGKLLRADATQVHRYLPLQLPAATRAYVRDAVQAGRATSAQFRVRGDLRELPFNDPRQGEFRIAAKLDGVRYAYVPKRLQQAGEPPWPVLQDLRGELVFDRSAMAVRHASSGVEGMAGLRFQKIEAGIADLAHSVVQVKADGRGPLADALAVVSSSPLAAFTGNALARATAAGAADYQLQLRLPLARIERSTVQGSVLLQGNDLRLAPDVPLLARARGTVAFTDQGFALQSVQARLLGGDVRIDGGLRPAAEAGGPATLQVRVAGTVTADGLRQARELGPISRLADSASGTASYSANLGLRGGVPEVLLTTSLQGLALNLPAPLGKPADTALPVRFESLLLPPAAGGNPAAARDQLLLEIGRVAAVQYQRDVSGARPRVLRGSIAVGLAPGESAPLPEYGVRANVNLAQTDIDAWEAVLGRAVAPPASEPSAAPASDADAMQGYLPTTLAVRARTLRISGRTLHNVVVGGSRDGGIWRANLDADEMNGYLEYRSGAAPRLYARLARLAIPPSATREVEALLDGQPGALPALDIVVDDFNLRGKKLGRVEIEAVNRGAAAQREWRLAKFNATTPEAQFTATGNWSVLEAGNVGPGIRRVGGERRTVMDFRLDIQNSGELLARFGMKDVVRRGKGRLEGQIAWIGSPISPDYASMAGQLQLNVEAGQFLQADPGLAKLLGVLSLQSLPRRLALDFRDVFSEGFAFDFVRGNVRIEEGIALSNNLQMKGVNAAVLMEGQADIARETQDLRVVVVPEINAGTASLVATAINPAIGLGTFLAQIFLRGPLIRATTQEFRITGAWGDPTITKLTGRQRTGALPGPAAPPASSAVPALPSAAAGVPGAP